MDRASPKIALSSELIEKLQATPWRYGFFALMRRINANPANDAVGTTILPGTEPFRVGQKPSLVFAPSEIADAQVKNGRLRIRLYSLGMLGPNGPLPIHVTEIAREREEHRRDPTLSNFLDIFHHRALTILYRAWASAQSAASLDRPEHDCFSRQIGGLSGASPRTDSKASLPRHVHLALAPHLVREARNPDALASSVAHYFGVPAQIEEWAQHWTVLPPELECRIGDARMSACLGRGAILGGMVLGRQHRFCVVLGPLDIDTYQRFTPRGQALLRLVAMVRAVVGHEYEWELELRIKPNGATPVVLGDGQQLGWSGWLGESTTGEPVVGMRFRPEEYIKRLVRHAARETANGQ